MFMANGSLQTLRQHYEQQGFNTGFVDRLLRRWEDDAGKNTMTDHRRLWDSQFVPYCESVDRDPYEYNVSTVANFLSHVQTTAESSQGQTKNHAKFKKARAAVVTLLTLFHPSQPSIAEHPSIKKYAAELRRSAPNLPKYKVAIKLDALFAKYIAEYNKGVRFETMPLKTLRTRALMLGRIKTHGRSADMAVVNRAFVNSVDDDVAGLLGDASLNCIEQIRYDFPKTWKTRSRFSELLCSPKISYKHVPRRQHSSNTPLRLAATRRYAHTTVSTWA
eukprot:COSAG05_NODE_94_length_19565_cov_15.870133_3_plen_276_part_00